MEILFQAKDKLTNEWIEGFVLNVDKTRFGHYDDGFNFALFYCIPETVRQFTGLTDKNKKKIFKGDIIEAITIDTNTPQRAVVGFGKYIEANTGEEYIGFYLEFNGHKVTITQLEMEEVKDRFEVIGNIYDNPELLEGQIKIEG